MSRVSERIASTSPGAPVLEVRGLTTTFAGTRHPAVDDVTFDLGTAETFGIVGESGSGKSALVRTMMDLLPRSAQTTGTIRYLGRDLQTMSAAERRRLWGPEIAMIMQDPMTALNPVRRIAKQMCDPMRRHLGISKSAAMTSAIELLELVQVPDARRRLESYPHELSGGLRQRVLIAIALACRPKVLIADEATTALDVTVQRQVLDLLGTLQRELSMSMIVISHDLGVVAGRTHRVGVMYAGRLVEQAPTARLFESMVHPYTTALFRSIPRLTDPRRTPLIAMRGAPPSLAEPIVGCGFRPRCGYAIDRCAEAAPELSEVVRGHTVACHVEAAAHEPAPTCDLVVRTKGR